MTHGEFTHILKRLGGLSPEQMQRLRRELDSKRAAVSNSGPGSIGAVRDADDALGNAVAHAMRQRPRRGKPPKTAKPQTQDDILRQMLADGLIARLPDPTADPGDDDEPVVIKGEPLSETIIRERR